MGVRPTIVSTAGTDVIDVVNATSMLIAESKAKSILPSVDGLGCGRQL